LCEPNDTNSTFRKYDVSVDVATYIADLNEATESCIIKLSIISTLQNIMAISFVKARRMAWEGHVTRKGEMRNG